MSKFSKKLAVSTSGSSLVSSLIMLIIYIGIAYIVYQIVMYFLNMRKSAMPNVPNRRQPRKNGGCSTGTCGK